MKLKNKCPDEETLAGYVERLLPQRQTVAVERHLARCDLCREQVAAYAAAIDPIAATDFDPVPERATQRAIHKALAQNRRSSVNQLRQGAGKMIRSGRRFVEWFTPEPGIPAVAVRGGDATTLEPVVTREKQFGDLHFLVTLERHARQTISIQVAWAKRPVSDTACRIALFRGERESASSILDRQPVLFEHMPFDAYALNFYVSGKRIGEYRFDIKDD